MALLGFKGPAVITAGRQLEDISPDFGTNSARTGSPSDLSVNKDARLLSTVGMAGDL